MQWWLVVLGCGSPGVPLVSLPRRLGERPGLASGLRRGQCGRQSRRRRSSAFPASALLPVGGGEGG